MLSSLSPQTARGEGARGLRAASGSAYTDAAVPDIVLTTLNARYAHASFGLRYLLANLPAALRPRTTMLEFDIAQRPIDAAEKILAADPKIVGIGVYIWNAAESQQLVATLKRVR